MEELALPPTLPGDLLLATLLLETFTSATGIPILFEVPSFSEKVKCVVK